MNEITQIISTVGFPIVACLGVAYFIVKTIESQRIESQKREERLAQENKEREERLARENKEREEKLFAQLNKCNETMDKFGETLISIDKRLEYIENKEKEEKAIN